MAAVWIERRHSDEDFAEADLGEADLRGANLDGANLQGLDLRDARLDLDQDVAFARSHGARIDFA